MSEDTPSEQAVSSLLDTIAMLAEQYAVEIKRRRRERPTLLGPTIAPPPEYLCSGDCGRGLTSSVRVMDSRNVPDGFPVRWWHVDCWNKRAAADLKVFIQKTQWATTNAAADKLRRLIRGEPTYTNAPVGEQRLSVSPSYLADILEELTGERE